MGSLEPRTEAKDKNELRTMVESLQSALYYHKQHIASEVKEVLSQELSQLVTISYKTLSDSYFLHISNLENTIKLELQAINHKIEKIESQSEDLHKKLKKFKKLFKQKNFATDNVLKEINDKQSIFYSNFSNSESFLKKIEENFIRLNNDIVLAKENISASRNNIINEVKLNLNENRREIDVLRYENDSKIQSEIFKLHEKMHELKYYIDEQLFKRERPQTEILTSSFKEMNVKDKEIFNYLESVHNKTNIEIATLRRRVESLEISEKTCEEFRKNRGK